MKANTAIASKNSEVKSKEEAVKKLRKERNTIKQESAMFTRKVQANVTKSKQLIITRNFEDAIGKEIKLQLFRYGFSQ